ncbi:conserved hypothetical protein (plasmid) [Pantoea sp. At-9b]|jgi:hypothetical protein|nr:conserved hypothetical protein [Pantoea sp. At-9b]
MSLHTSINTARWQMEYDDYTYWFITLTNRIKVMNRESLLNT